MYCKNCGKEINDGVKFCPNCGAEIAGGNNSEKADEQLYQYGAGKDTKNNAQSDAFQSYQYQTAKDKNGKEGKKKGGKLKWVLIIVGIAVVLLVMCSMGDDQSTQPNDSTETGTESTEENRTDKETEESETLAEETADAGQNYVLELYTDLQENEAIPYELNEKAKSFLREKYDYFPLDAENGAVYEEGVIDYSIETKMISKSPDKFGDKLMMLSQAGVVQIQEFPYGSDVMSFLNLIDDEGNQYNIIYPGELPDIYEDDIISVVIGLPIGYSTFENTDGGSTWAVVLAGSYIAKDAAAVPDGIGIDLSDSAGKDPAEEQSASDLQAALDFPAWQGELCSWSSPSTGYYMMPFVDDYGNPWLAFAVDSSFEDWALMYVASGVSAQPTESGGLVFQGDMYSATEDPGSSEYNGTVEVTWASLESIDFATVKMIDGHQMTDVDMVADDYAYYGLVE